MANLECLRPPSLKRCEQVVSYKALLQSPPYLGDAGFGDTGAVVFAGAAAVLEPAAGVFGAAPKGVLGVKALGNRRSDGCGVRSPGPTRPPVGPKNWSFNSECTEPVTDLIASSKFFLCRS